MEATSEAATQPGAAPAPATPVDEPIGRRHLCAWCGADNYASATQCRVCGTALRHTSLTVQCPACRRRQSANLVICIQCGREMRPAPRPSPWLIPTLTAIAVLVILWRV